MDDELVQAIDRVLSLSGGNLAKGKFTAPGYPLEAETFSVTTALNER